MQRFRIDDTQETLILTGLIISDKFIKEVLPILDTKLFRSDHARIIAHWCIDYYHDNHAAPGVHIEDIYNQAVQAEELENSEAKMLEQVLAKVSKEYERTEQFNYDYLLKVAETYFSSAHVKDECRAILDIVEDDPLAARDRLCEFKPKQLQQSQGYCVLTDRKLIRKAFEERQKPLFRIGGSMGQMMNPDLCRQNFIGFLGTEKIGKTWNLLHLAKAACRGLCNVALFQAGDMTDEQQTARIGISLTGKSDKPRYCGKLLIPTYDCVHNQTDVCNLRERRSKLGLGFDDQETFYKAAGKNHKDKKDIWKQATSDGYVPCDACRRDNPKEYEGSVWWFERPPVTPLTWREAAKASLQFFKRMRGRNLMLHSSPGDLSVDRIDSVLDQWERQHNFVADVVLTDYADLFVPSQRHQDFRHQTNQIWKDHRFLAQRRNCLVITATQADADAYGKQKLELTNFSEDKRKYAHVTAFYAMNQTQQEKVLGLMRLGWLVVRDDDFDTRTELKILRSLPTGQPVLGSYF